MTKTVREAAQEWISGFHHVPSFYTLLESAKLAGVEPHGYLRAAAEAASANEPPLLPHVHRNNLKTA